MVDSTGSLEPQLGSHDLQVIQEELFIDGFSGQVQRVVWEIGDAAGRDEQLAFEWCDPELYGQRTCERAGFHDREYSGPDCGKQPGWN